MGKPAALEQRPAKIIPACALFFMPAAATILRCTGIRGYLRLSTTTKSYIHFFPGTHCPPTIGVVQTFLTGIWVHWLGGGPCHCIGPTIVLSLVVRTASITDAAESGFCARLKTSSATSNRAWRKPSACVHCFLVTSSYCVAKLPRALTRETGLERISGRPPNLDRQILPRAGPANRRPTETAAPCRWWRSSACNPAAPPGPRSSKRSATAKRRTGFLHSPS